MLVALQDCDTEDRKKRGKGMEKVRRALEEFDLAWEKLKKIYEETRFISYPEGYVKDRYSHLASQSEDLSWMISVEKQYHKLVRDWLEANGG